LVTLIVAFTEATARTLVFLQADFVTSTTRVPVVFDVTREALHTLFAILHEERPTAFEA